MSKLPMLKAAIQDKAVLAKFEEVNSLNLDFQKEVGFALQHLGKNSYLQSASKESILTSVYNVALTGLSLSPVLAQAYLVPRKTRGQVQCCLEVSYQGLISKMIDLGQATDVYAHIVYEGDLFNYDMSTNSIIEHQPYWLAGNSQGKEVAAYAVAVLPNGSRKVEIKPMSYVNSVADASESVKSDKKNGTKYSPWNGSFREEMIKKTLVRQLWKYMPKNQKAEAMASVLDVENQTNAVDFTPSEIVDVPGGEAKVVTQENTKSKSAVDKVIKKVEGRQTPPQEPIQEATVVEEVKEEKVAENTPEAPVEEVVTPTFELNWNKDWKVYDETELATEKDLKVVQAILVERGLKDICISTEGKNTNKKMRTIILNHQEFNSGAIELAVTSSLNEKLTEATEMLDGYAPVAVSENPMTPNESFLGEMNDSNPTEEETVPEEQAEEISTDLAMEALDVAGIELNEVPEGEKRPFSEVQPLWAMLSQGDTAVSEANATEIFTELGVDYSKKEDLCFRGTPEHIVNFIAAVINKQ